MKILVTGACGFAGSCIIRGLLERMDGLEISGLDNFSRPGSELNRAFLRGLGVKVRHADVRAQSDFHGLTPVEWVIDAAANPSVIAGFDGRSDSRQVVEHNLIGTVNTLEFARVSGAGFVLLSTSRVYSIMELSGLPLLEREKAYVPDSNPGLPAGCTAAGVDESFPTTPPLSLYGSTKRASELLALEYGCGFGLPVWINRCGVLAGAGQFGTAEQGIFSYWIHAFASGRPLEYMGFGGKGLQVRDALHPDDLAGLVACQLARGAGDNGTANILNVSGGVENAVSLAQLSEWCCARFGSRVIGSDPVTRRFDVPWLVLDSHAARRVFEWKPGKAIDTILEEIGEHAAAHPEWLDVTRPFD